MPQTRDSFYSPRFTVSGTQEAGRQNSQEQEVCGFKICSFLWVSRDAQEGRKVLKRRAGTF
jgi:hypothetical protein